MANPTHIVLSPITTRKVDLYNKFYKVEEQHFDNTTIYNPMWNDSQFNTAKVGDYFGFVIDQDVMKIFRIETITDSRHKSS